MNPWRGVYGAVGRLFPEPFRRRHGAEIAAAFEAGWADARQRGVWAGHRFALVACVRAGMGAVADRFRGRTAAGGRGARRPRPRRATPWIGALRNAARTALRNPGHTAVTILISAVGLGGTAAVFTIGYEILVKPLDYPGAGALVTIGPDEQCRAACVSPTMLWAIEEAGEFERLGAIQFGRGNVTGDHVPLHVTTAAVTPEFWTVLGQPVPALPAADPTAAFISASLANRLFGSGPATGRIFTLDTTTLHVAGVLPADFHGPAGMLLGEVAVWTRLETDSLPPVRYNTLGLLGRLVPGRTVAETQRRVNDLVLRLSREDPAVFAREDGSAIPIRITSLHARTVRSALTPLVAMAVGAGLMLVAVGAGVVGLQVIRTIGRRKELVLRSVLGATSRILRRELLAESIVLLPVTIALGIGVAVVGVSLAARILPGGFPRIDELGGSFLPAIGITGVLVTGVGLLSTLGTWWWLRHAAPTDVLRTRETRPVGGWWRTVSLSLHTAVTGTLAVGATVLASEMFRLTATPLGYRIDDRLAVTVQLPREQVPEWTRMLQDGQRALAALPGVAATSAGLTAPLPLTPPYTLGGQITPVGSERPVVPVEFVPVAGDHFGFLDLPLVGTSFSDEDQGAIVITRSVADSLFGSGPADRAIGQQVATPYFEGAILTVAGVAPDFRLRGPDRPARPTVFLPLIRNRWSAKTELLFRVTGPPPTAAAVRGALAAVLPNVPVTDVERLTDRYRELTADERTQLLAVILFALGAGALSLLSAFTIGSRLALELRRELGIRSALGATSIRLVLESGRVALMAVVVGATASVVVLKVGHQVLAALIAGMPSPAPLVAAAGVGTAAALVLAGFVFPLVRAARTPSSRLLDHT